MSGTNHQRLPSIYDNDLRDSIPFRLSTVHRETGWLAVKLHTRGLSTVHSPDNHHDRHERHHRPQPPLVMLQPRVNIPQPNHGQIFVFTVACIG